MALLTYFFVIMSVVCCHEGIAAGVSRYGKPQLPVDFVNFPHINPKAPKGGALRLNAVGEDQLHSHEQAPE